MTAQTTLAAGALAALSVSALLAQQQTPEPKPYYQYRDTTPACSPQLTQAPVDQAIKNGLAALKSQKGEQAVCWLRLAAAQGSSFAQGAASLLLAMGTDGAPVDAIEARTLALKAVTVHSFLADLALYYLELGPRGEETGSAQKWWKAFNDDSAKATPEELDASHVVTDELNAKAARLKQSDGSSSISRNRTAQGVELPPMMHICAGGCAAGKGATLVLENGKYIDRTSPDGTGGVYTVERFTRESVIINRTDSGPRPGRAVIVGRLSPDGNALLDGNMKWTWHPCCGLGNPAGGSIRLAWGAAMNTVPGENAQGPQVQTANPQMMNPMAALAGLLAGAATDDDSGSGLPERIRSLQSRLDDAVSRCNASRPDLEPCQRMYSLRSDLNRAQGALRDEINQLRELCTSLDQQCKAGDDEACKKLKNAQLQLARDQQPIM